VLIAKDTWNDGSEVEVVGGPYKTHAEALAFLDGRQDKTLKATVLTDFWTGKRWMRGGHYAVRKIEKQKTKHLLNI